VASHDPRRPPGVRSDPRPGYPDAARPTIDLADELRDRLAELWLTCRRSSRWYIGDATEDQWHDAYAAVDAGWTGPPGG
jgi:hypothetical protein